MLPTSSLALDLLSPPKRRRKYLLRQPLLRKMAYTLLLLLFQAMRISMISDPLLPPLLMSWCWRIRLKFQNFQVHLPP